MPNLVGRFTFDNGYDKAGRRAEQHREEGLANTVPSRRGRILPLPIQLPQRFGSLRTGLGLQPPVPEVANTALLTRLAVLFTYTLGMLRHETDVTYKLHAGVPSPRSLFPSRLYVRVPFGHEVPMGWYRYHPIRHCIESVGVDVNNLPTVSDRATDLADHITVCVAADFRILADRYGEFALRLASIEAGHVVENLALLGRSLGWHPSLFGSFDDSLLAQTLGIEPVVEGIFAVVELRSDGCASTAGSAEREGHSRCTNAPRTSPEDANAASGMPQASHPTLGRLPHMQAMSAGVPRALPDTFSWVPALPCDCERIQLPQPAARPNDLRQLILSRNSGGEYRGLCARSSPVSQNTLATVLEPVAAPETASDMNDVFPSPYLMVAAIQVEGLPVGLYRYVPEGCELLQVYASGDAGHRLAEQLIGNGVTPEYLAFRVYVIAPTQEAFNRAANRAYRLLHMRAGAISQRISLAAAEQGLFCRPFLSIDEAECERTLGLTGTDHVILSHLLIGSNRYRGWICDMSL